MAGLAVRAEAQTSAAPTASEFPVNLSAGYEFYHDSALDMPAGFYLAVDSARPVSLAAEVTANFKSTNGVAIKLWSYLAGVRFAREAGQGTPYFQVLAGGSSIAGSSAGQDTVMEGFTIAPGLGVEIVQHGPRIGVRAQGAALFIHSNGTWSKALTVGVGVVFRVGK